MAEQETLVNDMATDAAGDTANQAQSAKTYTQEEVDNMMARMKVAIDELESVYGPMMKDWGYSNMASSEPDGVSRNNIVYWTRAEEPEFFRLHDQFGDMQKRHWGVVRNFIDRH